MNWEDFFLKKEYLKEATPLQERAYECLEELNIFHDLKEFTPVFVGTIPLDVDIEGSDLDIICEVSEFTRFEQRLKDCYEDKKNFLITEIYSSDGRSLVCRFDNKGFRVEIFGQKLPVQQQNGFLHLIAEAKLLEIGGDKAKHEIRTLKNQGHKTEPAFGVYFQIPGDSYIELLKLAPLSTEEIKKKLMNFPKLKPV